VIERVCRDVERELSRFGTIAGPTPLVDVWPAAVGPEIARNAWPARIARDGTLHVHTSSAAWAFELGQLEDRIRVSLGDLAPARIRFAVGPLPEPSADEAEKSPRDVIRPSATHAEKAVEITAEIEDENLRKVVAKAAALSLAKADSDR
jgi:hypothetical protein